MPAIYLHIYLYQNNELLVVENVQTNLSYYTTSL